MNARFVCCVRLPMKLDALPIVRFFVAAESCHLNKQCISVLCCVEQSVAKTDSSAPAKVSSNVCPYCEQSAETTIHILWECPCWLQQRVSLLDKFPLDPLEALPTCTKNCGIIVKSIPLQDQQRFAFADLLQRTFVNILTVREERKHDIRSVEMIPPPCNLRPGPSRPRWRPHYHLQCSCNAARKPLLFS